MLIDITYNINIFNASEYLESDTEFIVLLYKIGFIKRIVLNTIHTINSNMIFFTLFDILFHLILYILYKYIILSMLNKHFMY